MMHATDALLEETRRVIARVLAPVANEADEQERFPLDAFRQLGRHGLFGVAFPEELGGAGLDYRTQTAIVGELAGVCASTAMATVAHSTLTCTPILVGGSEAVKHRYLPRMLAGDCIGAFGLTEAGSGSDISSIRTTAVEDGDHYRLNGAKVFITNANVADVALVAARTSPAAGLLGISLFLVDRSLGGLRTSGVSERKLGMRASDTGELVLDDVRVPRDHLVGRRDRGFELLHQTLTGARVDMAAIALGLSKRARDLSLDHALRRTQFGHPIARFQLVQAKLADMEVRISAAEALIDRALRCCEAGHPFVKEASEAKLFATEAAVDITRDAIQIHGAMGCSRDLPLERLYRDAKVTEIGDGTSEIQRLIIADELFKAHRRTRPHARSLWSDRRTTGGG